MIGLHHYLVLAAFMFAAGVFVMSTKRNAVGILIGVELILNAANVNLVAASVYTDFHAPFRGLGALAAGGPMSGQVTAMFVIVLAAAEAAIAIAIFMNFYNNRNTIDVDRADQLKG